MEVRTSMEEDARVTEVEVSAWPMSSGSKASCSIRLSECVILEAMIRPEPGGIGVMGVRREEPKVTTVVVTPLAIPNWSRQKKRVSLAVI
jgi:hypothetical protein